MKKKDAAICTIHSVSTRTKLFIEIYNKGVNKLYKMLCTFQLNVPFRSFSFLEDVPEKFPKAKRKKKYSLINYLLHGFNCCNHHVSLSITQEAAKHCTGLCASHCSSMWRLGSTLFWIQRKKLQKVTSIVL